MKRGLLLVNLGTPDEPTSGAVRRYLREFLSDPRVIDINPVGRWFLLNLIILPFRPAKSAEAYRKVWTSEGSPLMVHSRALEKAVREKVGGEFEVELAMRYGNPSLPDAIERLKAKRVDEIVVLPLYPQDAASSVSSTVARLYEVMNDAWDVLPVKVIPTFHDDAGFIDSWAQVAKPLLAEKKPDHVLFSFHGLPERHMVKSDPTGAHCLRSDSCCNQLSDVNRHCYRAQCFATARALSSAFGLPAGGYTVSFQSRLGRTPWVKPYTDLVLPELAKKHAHLAVLCPAFVADCLETLEEIGIRAREQFVSEGGKELTLIPCLNSHPRWVDAVVDIVRRGESAPA